MKENMLKLLILLVHLLRLFYFTEDVDKNTDELGSMDYKIK